MSWYTRTSLVNKWLQALPPFPTPVSFCFIFIFALSQFCWPDYLGAWNRLASHTDILRGSLRVPAPLTCDKPLRTFTGEARNSYFSEGMVFTGKQELSMSSSHIILDFKSIRELGMVQSSINSGVIKQTKSSIQGLFVRDSGVSAILLGGECELPLVLFFVHSVKEWKN